MSGSPLVLASASSARRQLLADAGLSFTVKPAGLDESAVRDRGARNGWTPAVVALALAEAKANAVAAGQPGAVVLGADQVAVCGGAILGKARDRAEAAAGLARLSGRSHRLISAVALVAGGAVVWRYAEAAVLQMRTLSDPGLAAYLDSAGDDVIACVGGYRIEGPGVQLFDRIEGEFSTIMGLPMLPLLAALRRLGVLAG